MFSPTLKSLWVVGAAAILSVFLAASLAMAQNGGGHGPDRDPVTGWRCLSAICDVTIQPGTRCVCRKENPNETVARRLRFVCLQHAPSKPCVQSFAETLR